MIAFRLARTAVGAAICGAALGLLAALALPLLGGVRPHTIGSGSMQPVLEQGDVAVVAPARPGSVRVGEIIAFRDPKRPDLVMIHRVRGVQPVGGRVAFVTQGDAGSEPERWAVARDGSVGRVVRRLPKLGYLGIWPSRPAARLISIAVPVLVLALLLLVRIWRPTTARPRAGDAGTTAVVAPLPVAALTAAAAPDDEVSDGRVAA